jgi:hypothetical protein
VQFLHFAMEYLLNLKLKKFSKNKNDDIWALVQYLVIYNLASPYYLASFVGFIFFKKL